MISLFGVQGLGVLPQSFILLVSPYSVHDTNLLGEVAKTLNPKPSLQTYCGLDKLPTHLSSIRNLHYMRNLQFEVCSGLEEKTSLTAAQRATRTSAG